MHDTIAALQLSDVGQFAQKFLDHRGIDLAIQHAAEAEHAWG
jgi:hypothetical protein